MIHRFHNYELDDRLYELRRLGERVELERKVFDVLLYLVRHRDRVVTKAELNEAVWNGVAVSDAALVRCVVEARRAVGDDGVRQEVIETRRGRGYRFVAEARGDEPATTGARVETARPVAGGAGGLAPSLSAVHVGARAEAYDYFLRGLEHFMRMTREGNAVAREMAQRALELDPDFAAAFTALGWTHVRDWMNFWTLDAGVLESAARLAERALQLDEGLAMTHTLMAAVALYQLDHVRALHETERALTLDSTAPECLAIRSLVASHAGLADGARDAIEQAMSLNPQYPAFYLSHLGRAHRVAGRHDLALDALVRALRRDPAFLPARVEMALLHAETGRHAEARATAAEILHLRPALTLATLRGRLPYRDPEYVEHCIATLRAAGLS